MLNLMIVKQGPGALPGLTDSEKPRMRGPKRASKIRKLFALDAKAGAFLRRGLLRTSARLTLHLLLHLLLLLFLLLLLLLLLLLHPLFLLLLLLLLLLLHRASV